MRYLTIFILSVTCLLGQYVPNTSVSISDDASSLIVNPAGLGIGRSFNLLELGLLNNDPVQGDFGLYFQVKRTGFGFTNIEGGRNLFHWASGEHLWKGIYLGSVSHFSSDGYEMVDMGTMYRGYSWFSAGVLWKNVWSRIRNGARQDQILQLGLAFRPLGNRITVAYDHRISFDEGGNSMDIGGIAQFETEPIDGVKLFASYDLKSEGIQIGLGIGFGGASAESYHNINSEGNYGSSLIGIQVSEDVRRTFYQKRNPVFIEIAFETPITDSPDPKVLFGPKTITLRRVIKKIRDMADDPDIDGIVLKPDYYATGTGMMEEFIQALRDFKLSGKKIYAFINAGSDVAYSLACVADSIYLNSGGFLMVDGLAFGVGFWKGLFDKIGVDAQFYRRGDYKTAAEVYTKEHLSDSSRKAYEAILEDLQAVYSNTIMDGRGWSREKLTEVYDGALYTAQMALETGLVDGIYHPDQIEAKIKKIVGEEVSVKKVRKLPNKWVYDWQEGAAPKIALIYAEGPILPGKSKPSMFGGDKIIGSETTAKAIRKAREDKSVKAIVMRVNSPGGSVLASEDIWREVYRTTHPDSNDKKNRKPFIISMANVAASGGYYISCAADTIVADPATITGSIGVLSGKISLGGLFEKIGFNIDIVKEQPHAEQFGMHRSFTDEEGKRMQAIVDSFYDLFLDRVSEGRKMTRDEVNAVAQGRIWSGVDAKEKGLVDILGGLDVAMEIARNKAVLEEGEYNLKIYKGVEDHVFEFEMEAKSDIEKIINVFDTNIPISKMLDRAKLINDEQFLYMMEEEIILDD